MLSVQGSWTCTSIPDVTGISGMSMFLTDVVGCLFCTLTHVPGCISLVLLPV